MSGLEEQEYMDDPGNLEMYDVNTVANYDPRIVPLLDAAAGSAFESGEEGEPFVAAADWQSPER